MKTLLNLPLMYRHLFPSPEYTPEAQNWLDVEIYRILDSGVGELVTRKYPRSRVSNPDHMYAYEIWFHGEHLTRADISRGSRFWGLESPAGHLSPLGSVWVQFYRKYWGDDPKYPKDTVPV